MRKDSLSGALTQLTRALVMKREDKARELLQPGDPNGPSNIENSLRDVIKIAKHEIQQIESYYLLDDGDKYQIKVKIQTLATKIMAMASRLCRQTYQSSGVDIFLSNLFYNKHEWLALAAIATVDPCAKILYDRIEQMMEDSSSSVKFAYRDFKTRRLRCMDQVPRTPSPVRTPRSSTSRSPSPAPSSKGVRTKWI